MADDIPMTQAGYNKKKAELDRLNNEEMPKVSERIALARAEGDLKENAEYHGARETQGMLQAKINQLRDQLSRATIMDVSTMPRDEVAFGCIVKVKDLDFDDEEEFTLVGAGEEDYNSNKILITSPIGQGLLGKKIGQVAEIAVPKGSVKFEVLEIRWEE